jgi:uncharacterized protein YdeI (YjbR/CyaY-like superfamily)
VITKPIGFTTPADLRHWLKKNHAKAPELMLRCFKMHARDQGVTYLQALDEALCFGWIDGVRRSLDAETFVVRFTPRKAKSKWSAVNLRKFKRLTAAGRVHPAGHAAYRARNKHAKPYSFEAKPATLDRGSAALLKANNRAWSFFQSQPPWYRRTTVFFVMSAKREETRRRRLALLISCSAAGKTIPPLTR